MVCFGGYFIFLFLILFYDMRLGWMDLDCIYLDLFLCIDMIYIYKHVCIHKFLSFLFQFSQILFYRLKLVNLIV
jgi:hypothetical protein